MSSPRSAMTPQRERRLDLLSTANLYLCTPARADRGELRDFLHDVYAGGVDIVQLRDKSISTSQEIAALEVLAEVAGEHGKLFAVNDRADIAALLGADVFHVGQDDLTIPQARELLGPEVIIGLSTHSLPQAQAAMTNPDLDYFCTGPLWETPTKPGRAATGLELVTQTAEMLNTVTDPERRNMAWFTIGGVNARTLPAIQAAAAKGGGARVRAVVVRALTEAENPRGTAMELKGLLA